MTGGTVHMELYWCLSGAAEAAGWLPRWALMAKLLIEHSNDSDVGLYLVFTAPCKQPGPLSLVEGRKEGQFVPAVLGGGVSLDTTMEVPTETVS